MDPGLNLAMLVVMAVYLCIVAFVYLALPTERRKSWRATTGPAPWLWSLGFAGLFALLSRRFWTLRFDHPRWFYLGFVVLSLAVPSSIAFYRFVRVGRRRYPEDWAKADSRASRFPWRELSPPFRRFIWGTCALAIAPGTVAYLILLGLGEG